MLVGLSWSLASALSTCAFPELVALAGAVHVVSGCHILAVGATWWPTPGAPVPSDLGASLVSSLESHDAGLVLVGWKTPVDPRYCKRWPGGRAAVDFVVVFDFYWAVVGLQCCVTSYCITK